MTASGTWQVASDDAAALLRGPVRAEVVELGVIAVSGNDAAAFLQGQLTNEVVKLGAEQLTFNGYCTAKGRLLATFRCWRDEQVIYLQLPRELVASVVKRLSMFVLRAKVNVVDDSASWITWAIFGNGAAARLEQVFGSIPAGAGDCLRMGPVRLARLAAGATLAERFLLLAPSAEAASMQARLAGLPQVPSGVFWWSEIDAAVPTVFAATQEKFVPQMINFEVVGGVSFSKGCYPGQEVVARSQYRGKLKRRMQRARCGVATLAGADVFAVGEDEPVGNVVMAASHPEGGIEVLFECTLEKAEAPLRLHSPDGPALDLLALPYDIVDVTA
jgi:folate-binding protein YgfZ